MQISTEPRHLARIQTAKILSNTEEFSPNSCKIHNKLPSGNFSLIKQGEELSLRPSSPHRYNSSFTTRDTNSFGSSKHSRCSTVSGLFKFIPATELVSFEEFQTPEEENPTEEVSDELISNLSFEEEPKHSVVYPSLYSNRNSLIGSTTDRAVNSLATSPQDQRVSTIYTISSTTSYKQSQANFEFFDRKPSPLKENFSYNKQKSNNGIESGKVYCEKCKENVGISMQVRNHQENL